MQGILILGVERLTGLQAANHKLQWEFQYPTQRESPVLFQIAICSTIFWRVYTYAVVGLSGREIKIGT